MTQHTNPVPVTKSDVDFLRDLAGRLFRNATPALGFDQGDTDRLYGIAHRLASTPADAPSGEGLVEEAARIICPSAFSDDDRADDRDTARERARRVLALRTAADREQIAESANCSEPAGAQEVEALAILREMMACNGANGLYDARRYYDVKQRAWAILDQTPREPALAALPQPQQMR